MMNKNKATFSIFTSSVLNETAFLDFRHVIGPIVLHRNVSGQGENGIVVIPQKDPQIVVKLKKIVSNADDLKEESIQHILFQEALKVAKNRYKDIIDATIKIPQIYSGVQDQVPYIKMERIHGQTIKTRFYRKLYAYELNNLGYTNSELDDFSDYTFELLLRFYGLYIAPPRLIFREDFEAIVQLSQLNDYFLSHLHATPLGNVLDYLEWKGLYHNDLHAGNIMIDKNNNTYIIDFGKSYFDAEKSKNAIKTENLIGHS